MTPTQKLTVLFIGITALLTGSCRKGEEDPKLSLLSRKSRLAGEWRLKSGLAAFTANFSNPPAKYNDTWTFDGSSYRLNGTYVGIYYLNLNVRKNGTFDFSELFLGNNLECNGTWSFTSGEGEEKNKERVVFTITELKKGATFDGLFNQTATNFRYDLTRLAKKEIKLRSVGNLALAEENQSIEIITDYTFFAHEE